jgi:hypothetical protein
MPQPLPWSWELIVATWALVSCISQRVSVLHRINHLLFLNQAEKFWHGFFFTSKSLLGNPCVETAQLPTQTGGATFCPEDSPSLTACI